MVVVKTLNGYFVPTAEFALDDALNGALMANLSEATIKADVTVALLVVDINPKPDTWLLLSIFTENLVLVRSIADCCPSRVVFSPRLFTSSSKMLSIRPET